MPHSVTWLDRLRIERFVWALDQQIYDLPRASRIAKRREVRANLLEAARDVGTGAALRNLGSTRRLANEYLTAEFGDGPRHSWLAAACFAGLFPLLALAFLDEAANAYQQAITAINPHATGTFTWQGISLLQTTITYTFTDGHPTRTGGAFTAFAYAAWLAGTLLAGRLWRLRSAFRRTSPAA